MERTIKASTKQFARVGKSWPSTGFIKTNFLKNLLMKVTGNQVASEEK
ncbi:hypothetical protein KO493_01535 [Tamlana agarivorans]|uniref:Uncharacterized protein n=1 Tax=Pseudotamlana agarivorans TaxID=481183 RepID=A0ACC5U4X6_9FLAO|nr:hypothetical protein [Tamlana agarivorans]MBU2949372.1 hypothetical protein [Tamlana agarivorans]